MKCYVGEWIARPVGDCIDTSVFNMAHPRNFAEVLEKHRKERPDVNIWTNNPCAVGKFSPKEVFVCCLDANGKSVCKCITEHPSYKKWHEEMDPGEMWSLFGERWVLNQ